MHSGLDLLPQNTEHWAETELFLKQVVEILLDYIREENDRSSKILDFHHPDEMKKLIDLSIPDKPMKLDELIKVSVFIAVFVIKITLIHSWI